ncbi:hypothetical protein [Nevskia sp.]|uniref:hypothetical protein n=1 Tax=Nevskia sp. TaxID=1929292 RepID=UPI0025E0CFF7|nr:hypothetical protein [Nevskia sp.]
MNDAVAVNGAVPAVSAGLAIVPVIVAVPTVGPPETTWPAVRVLLLTLTMAVLSEVNSVRRVTSCVLPLA